MKSRSKCRSAWLVLVAHLRQPAVSESGAQPRCRLPLAANPSHQMPPQLVAIVVPFVRSTRRHSSLAARCACAEGRSGPTPRRCHHQAMESTTCWPCGRRVAHGGCHSFRKSTSTIGNDVSQLVRSATRLGRRQQPASNGRANDSHSRRMANHPSGSSARRSGCCTAASDAAALSVDRQRSQQPVGFTQHNRHWHTHTHTQCLTVHLTIRVCLRVPIITNNTLMRARVC